LKDSNKSIVFAVDVTDGHYTLLSRWTRKATEGQDEDAEQQPVSNKSHH
jgi:hypothetical protein